MNNNADNTSAVTLYNPDQSNLAKQQDNNKYTNPYEMMLEAEKAKQKLKIYDKGIESGVEVAKIVIKDFVTPYFQRSFDLEEKKLKAKLEEQIREHNHKLEVLEKKLKSKTDDKEKDRQIIKEQLDIERLKVISGIEATKINQKLKEDELKLKEREVAAKECKVAILAKYGTFKTDNTLLEASSSNSEAIQNIPQPRAR